MTAPLLAFNPKVTGGLPVSLDRLIESRLLIQANSGGGKSRAIRYLLEQTFGRVQHIVLDREGEFSTLRERFGYALAGPGGETVADVRSAKMLARGAMEKGFSLIVDLSEMSLPQQRQYIKAFLDSINHLPRDLWKDCLIVIDEAHLFAPESGKGDGTALEAIALLLSTGRKRGYCAVLATQRIAKLSKDVAAECLNKMIGRTSEEDVKRAAEEIGMPRAEAKSLRALNAGEFWSYGPAIGIDPVLARTGEVQTAPPKRGALREPAPPTPAAIKQFLADLADLPQKQADEDRTVDDLRKDLREAKAQLARAQKNGVERIVEKAPVGWVSHETMVSQVSAATAAARREEAQLYDRLLKASEKAASLLGQVAELSRDGSATLLGKIIQNGEQRVSGASVEGRSMEASRAVGGSRVHSEPRHTPSPRVVRAAPAEGVSGVEQRILNTLAGLEGLGQPEPDKATVGALIGYSNIKSKSFQNASGSLRTSGRIIYPTTDTMALTDAGRAIAMNELPVSSRAELHEMWCNLLGGVARKIITTLIEAYPDALPIDDVAAMAGYENTKSKSFANTKGRLSTLGLVSASNGLLGATDLLFPKGLR